MSGTAPRGEQIYRVVGVGGGEGYYSGPVVLSNTVGLYAVRLPILLLEYCKRQQTKQWRTRENHLPPCAVSREFTRGPNFNLPSATRGASNAARPWTASVRPRRAVLPK